MFIKRQRQIVVGQLRRGGGIGRAAGVARLLWGRRRRIGGLVGALDVGQHRSKVERAMSAPILVEMSSGPVMPPVRPRP